MKRTPNRLEILKSIGDHFQSLIQWTESRQYALAGNYEAKAEALIELLEVCDCGSVGGFDKKQGVQERKNLFARWDWLYRKYNDPEGKRFGCGILSYVEIRDFFNK